MQNRYNPLIAIVAGILFFFHFSALGQNADSNVQQMATNLGHSIQMGDAFFNRGDFTKASEFYRDAVAFNKDTLVRSDKLYFNLAYCELQLGQLDKAITDYNSSINFNPNFAPAYWNRGIAYERNNNYQMAIDDYTKAIPYFEDDSKSKAALYNNVAINERKLKHYQKAVMADSMAIHLEPDFGNAYQNRANCYRMMKEFQLAIADNTTAIGLLGKEKDWRCEAYIELGLCHDALKMYDSALQDYANAEQLKPKNRYIYLDRSYTYNALNDLEASIKDITTAIDLFAGENSTLVELYDRRALAEARLRRYDEAIRDDFFAITQNPAYAFALWNLGNVYAAKGEHQQAFDNHQKAISFYTNNKRATATLYYLVARDAYALKNNDQVMKNGQAALAINPGMFNVYYYFGKVALKKNDREEADRNFKKVLALDTSKRSAAYVFSLYYTGKAQKAIQIEKSSLASVTAPYETVNYYYSLACLLSLNNDLEQANSYLKKAIDGGYSKAYARQDEDLHNLQATPEFKSLVGDAGANQ